MATMILLHGATGIWDEVACLAVPATVVLGVALIVLRQPPREGDAPDGTEQLANEGDAGATDTGAALTGRTNE